MALKRKAMAGAAALALVALIATGTFAWTSLNSQRLNEWRGVGSNPEAAGPGGTLHDDHVENGEDKQVYIENWGDKPLFARIRLDEYMEVGTGAGLKSEAADPDTGEILHNPENLAESLITGANIDKLDTWKPHIPSLHSDPSYCWTEKLHEYWKWQMGGQKYYFPAPEGGREDKSYISQVSPADLSSGSVNDAGVEAKQTLTSSVLTMVKWKDEGSQIGNYWVIDRDGWAYWASPLEPGNATGLLINKVEPDKKPDKDYYYGINVIAQMATKDGDELDNYESFSFDINSGWTDDGQKLMELITGDVKPTPPAGIYFNNYGRNTIDNTIYAKPGEFINIKGYGSSYFTVEGVYINNIKSEEQANQDYYRMQRWFGDEPILSFKAEAPTGYKLPIIAEVRGTYWYTNQNGILTKGQQGSRWDTSKTAVVIPEDCSDVTKGKDGKIYLKYLYSDRIVYRELKDDGTLGPESSTLP